MKYQSFRHIVLLSSFLDGRTNKRENKIIKSSLEEDLQSQEILGTLREIRYLLRNTPKKKIPRNFRLSPMMVGMKPPVPRSVPIFRMASAAAAMLLVVSFTITNLASSMIGPRMAADSFNVQSGGGGGGCGYDNPADCPPELAPALAYGIGGGEPESDTSRDQSSTAPEPTEPSAGQTLLIPEPDAMNLEQPMEPEIAASKIDSQSTINPIYQLNPLQIGLILLSLSIAGIAIIIRQVGIIKWRKRL